MERKVLLKDLVSTGTHIRAEFMPKAVVSDKGKYPIGEFWDANKTIDVIVNGAHETHDTINELDTYAHAEETRAKTEEQRLDRVKVGRITVDNVKALTNAQIDSLNAGDVVIKNEDGSNHIYAVAYKQDDEMSLVYADCWTVEEVYYEKSGDDWAYIQTDVFKPADYYKKTELATVAVSGSYTDLSDKPTIPTVPSNVSAFNNDAGYLTQHQDLSSLISRIEALEVAAGINQPEEPVL